MQWRRRSSELRLSSPVLVVLAVIVLFAVVMIASAVQGRPQFAAIDVELGNGAVNTPVPEPSSTADPPPQDTETPWWLTALAVLLGAALALGVIILLVAVVRVLLRMAREWWQNRALPLQEGSEITAADAGEMASEAEPDAVRVQRGLASALQRIREHAAPSEGIVAAWVGVEDAAADAGVTRGDSETAAELSLRVIAHRSQISGETQELLGLYERVRFGGYVAAESDRRAARALLERIEREWR